jgi:uncharacterized peroxidase-related enzyme
MAHIATPGAGMGGLLAFRPETGRLLAKLVKVLLHGPSTLTAAERELIAAVVSARNECPICQITHGGNAAAHLGGNAELVRCVVADYATADISDKLKSLLAIATKVQQSGRDVTNEDVAAARREGATDIEIHDTVLIAAAFCMFNRYVDGLATSAPNEAERFRKRGRSPF